MQKKDVIVFLFSRRIQKWITIFEFFLVVKKRIQITHNRNGLVEEGLV